MWRKRPSSLAYPRLLTLCRAMELHKELVHLVVHKCHLIVRHEADCQQDLSAMAGSIGSELLRGPGALRAFTPVELTASSRRCQPGAWGNCGKS